MSDDYASTLSPPGQALGSLARLTELQAQERFIELVSQSETFGLSMHTITVGDVIIT